MATVKAKGQEVRARPPQNDEVVIATVSGVSYADILKKMMAEPKLKELGQTVLILLNKTMLIEVKDIDEISGKTVLRCAVKTQFVLELPESSRASLGWHSEPPSLPH